MNKILKFASIVLCSWLFLVHQARSTIDSVRYESTRTDIIGPPLSCIDPITEGLSVDDFVLLYGGEYKLTHHDKYIKFTAKSSWCSETGVQGIAIKENGVITSYLLLEPIPLSRLEDKETVINSITSLTENSTFLPSNLYTIMAGPLKLYESPSNGSSKHYLLLDNGLVIYEGLIKPNLDAEVKQILIDYIRNLLQDLKQYES